MITFLNALVEWAHIVAGIFWIGSVMYAFSLLLPSLRDRPQGADELLRAIEVRRRRAVTGAAGVAIALGFLRGIMGGALGANLYTWTWLASLALGLGLIAWNLLATVPAIRRVADGGAAVDVGAGLSQIRQRHLVELLGFYLLLALMVAMSMGY